MNFHPASASGDLRLSLEKNSLRLLLLGTLVLMASPAPAWAEEAPEGASISEAPVPEETAEPPAWASLNRVGLNFSSTLFGPSAATPSSPFQPDIPGMPEGLERPILIRSVTTLTYALGESTGIRTNLSWDWTPTDGEPHFALRDPQLHFYESSILSAGPFNWYGDVRVMPGVTRAAHDEGLIAGFQSFHVLSLAGDRSRWSANTYLSIRWNLMKKAFLGDDLQTFVAPHVGYAFSEKLSSSIQLEFTGGHRSGDPGDLFFIDPAYLVPGMEWAPTPAISVEPYLSIPVSQETSMKKTALGLSFSWTLL